jgi:hypothetical protein
VLTRSQPGAPVAEVDAVLAILQGGRFYQRVIFGVQKRVRGHRLLI